MIKKKGHVAQLFNMEINLQMSANKTNIYVKIGYM